MEANADTNLALVVWQYKWWDVNGTVNGEKRLLHSLPLCPVISVWWRHHNLISFRECIALDQMMAHVLAFNRRFNLMPDFSQHLRDQCWLCSLSFPFWQKRIRKINVQCFLRCMSPTLLEFLEKHMRVYMLHREQKKKNADRLRNAGWNSICFTSVQFCSPGWLNQYGLNRQF